MYWLDSFLEWTIPEVLDFSRSLLLVSSLISLDLSSSDWISFLLRVLISLALRVSSRS